MSYKWGVTKKRRRELEQLVRDLMRKAEAEAIEKYANEGVERGESVEEWAHRLWGLISSPIGRSRPDRAEREILIKKLLVSERVVIQRKAREGNKP